MLSKFSIIQDPPRAPHATHTIDFCQPWWHIGSNYRILDMYAGHKLYKYISIELKKKQFETYIMFLCTAMILTLLANGQYLLLKIRNFPGVAGGRRSPEKYKENLKM